MNATSRRQEGTAYGILAYFIWGIFPLYFVLLDPAGPWEVVAHRIIWTLTFCAAVLLITRDVHWLVELARHPRRLAGVGIAGALIAVNWGVYTYAVLTGHVAEAALGYFLNPLVTVALGVIILRERLRPGQWAAVGIGAVAALYLTIDYGRPPWISLTLAFSFATYALLKNRLGVTLTAFRSLTGETLALFPVAIAILLWVNSRNELTFSSHGMSHSALLLSLGATTAIPLLLFAAAASRVPLSTIGLMQFIAPILQLLCAVILGEELPLSRWAGFAMVWLALVVLTWDMMAHVRRIRRQRKDLQDPAP